MDGMEVTQFTYFQQCGGVDCNPIPIEMSQTAKTIYERTRTGIHGAIGDDRLPNFADLVPLRQICSHPELDDFKKGQPLNPIANSHKYERLVEILTQSENQKSIIFTQWITKINLMTQDLDKRFKNHFIIIFRFNSSYTYYEFSSF